jgi:intein/homing endonuclease
VISYNIATGEYQPDVVVQLHHNLTKSSSELMYELIMDDGTTLQVTGNHPIMTTIGYVRADELTQAHEIINIPECRKT